MKAFITGIGSGIGRETCLEFLTKGWAVVGVVRNPNHEKELVETAKLLKGKLVTLNLDLSDSNFQDQLNASLSSLNNPEFNVLINIAGVLSPMSVTEYSFEKIQQVLSVNFISSALIIQSLIPYMKRRGTNNIINISSMSGFQGSLRFPGLAIYGASKAALSSLTESLAVELAEYNIHINALAIGSVNTQMLKTAFPDYSSPIQPEQMAKYIYSFASEGFKLYNGKTLPVAVTNP